MFTSSPFHPQHRTLSGPTDNEKSLELFPSNKRCLSGKAEMRSLTALSHDGPPTSFPQHKDSNPFMCTALTCSHVPLMHNRDLQMQHSSPVVIIHGHCSFDAWKRAWRRVSSSSSSRCNTFSLCRSPWAPPPSASHGLHQPRHLQLKEEMVPTPGHHALLTSLHMHPSNRGSQLKSHHHCWGRALPATRQNRTC